ncbi:WRKY transcription factor [Quillaja saponaria]|uniref:WRKY transcription factor n=1 Tax=Quillaja saponaria TaxID=32244 RepID=A0AAD7LSE2_QUISA|nr:WRKY transcription factor [Quillaja saponaria]
MAGIDDNIAIIGDWVPPIPSPRTFFSTMLIDDIGSKPITGPSISSRTEELFHLGPQKAKRSGKFSIEDTAQGSASCEQFPKLDSFAEQKPNARGGLLERMAARAGFNAPRLNTESIKFTDLPHNSDIRSPYLTIPPGLSPTTLLDSPVFLSNSLAQPSPTTGKFPFISNGTFRCSALTSEDLDQNTDISFDDMNSSSFAFKPATESGSPFFLGASSKITPATLPQQSCPGADVSVQSENSIQSRVVHAIKLQNQNKSGLHLLAEFTESSTEQNNGINIVSADLRIGDPVGGSAEDSPPLDEQPDDEGNQRGSGDSICAGGGGALSEDGYNWRKYGQKQVKGSEYPRSYYKCTHPNCQVKKKIERSHEGHVTEIIYKGSHNHSKPPPNRRSGTGAVNPLTDMHLENPEQDEPQSGADGGLSLANAQKGNIPGVADWKRDNLEVMSSASVDPEYGNQSSTLQAQNDPHFESVDASSTFSNDEYEHDQGHGSLSLGYDGEGDESESKRRKIESYATEMSGATRAIREPRVVVQTTSEVDILDDGYRWRKYGQKVVKGNPNPRSYYKCTNAGCTVRKHVERASHDLKSVITTYEGKHNHDVPAARNSSHVNAGASITLPAQAPAANIQAHVKPSQVHNSMGRFERPAIGSFSLPGRQQLGIYHGFSFAMNQPGLDNLAMTGLDPGQAKLPVMPIHPYLAQQRSVNEMGFLLPKGETKVEPMHDPGLNVSSGSAVYQQIMSGLPLGPQM